MRFGFRERTLSGTVPSKTNTFLKDVLQILCKPYLDMFDMVSRQSFSTSTESFRSIPWFLVAFAILAPLETSATSNKDFTAGRNAQYEHKRTCLHGAMDTWFHLRQEDDHLFTQILSQIPRESV